MATLAPHHRRHRGNRRAASHLRDRLRGRAGGAALPLAAGANVRTPYSFDLSPPTSGRDAFIKWMVENRGENPKILAARWDRYLFLQATTGIS